MKLLLTKFYNKKEYASCWGYNRDVYLSLRGSRAPYANKRGKVQMESVLCHCTEQRCPIMALSMEMEFHWRTAMLLVFLGAVCWWLQVIKTLKWSSQ